MRIDVVILVCLFSLAFSSFFPLTGVAAYAQERQSEKVYRIGFLAASPPPTAWAEAFQRGLRERGYVIGQNVILESRFADGSIAQLPPVAEELVRLMVDVIVARDGPSAVAAKKATASIPIVFTNVFEPVELGLVQSLAHPGGNITGLAITSADLSSKRLELLKEVVPKLRRVAVLSPPANAYNPMQLKGAEVAARTLGMQLQHVSVREPSDFDAAFRSMRGVDGLLQVQAQFLTTHRVRLVGLAAKHRLPVAYGTREWVDAGGLLSYGANFADLYRRAAAYVDKILKGAKPADLPVEQPTTYELVINTRTANSLGLIIPPALLLRADQVLE